MATTAKKNSSALARITIFSPVGQVNHKCEILRVDTGISVYIRYKKPRSSKFARKHVPWGRIITFSSGDKNTDGFISYKSERIQIIRPFKGTVEVDEKTRRFIVTSEDGIIYNVDPECLEAIADESGDKETKSKKK